MDLIIQFNKSKHNQMMHHFKKNGIKWKIMKLNSLIKSKKYKFNKIQINQNLKSYLLIKQNHYKNYWILRQMNRFFKQNNQHLFQIKVINMIQNQLNYQIDIWIESKVNMKEMIKESKFYNFLIFDIFFWF